MRFSEQLQTINTFRGQAPVNLNALASAIGLTVQYAYLEEQISGMLEKTKGTEAFKATINVLHPITRQRFTLAHEIGHYMLHRSLVGDGLDDDKAYRSTEVGKYHNTSIGPKQETEANRFAAGLLMPKSLIEEEWTKLCPNVSAMAAKFNVSEAAMKIRLRV